MSGGLGRVAAALREGDWLRAAIFVSRRVRVVQIDRVLILSGDVEADRPLLRKLRDREKDLTLREATVVDLPLLRTAFPHNAEKFAERFSRGDSCLLVSLGKEAAAVGWIQMDVTHGVRELGTVLTFPEGACWGHDTYVLPPFRSRGAFAVLMDEMFSRLRKLGYRSMLASVTWENAASRASHGRLGYTTALVLDRLSLVGLQLYRVQIPGVSVRWIRRGRINIPPAGSPA